MKLDGARREGHELVLTTSDPAAWRWLYGFTPGEWEIVKARKKRSLDANAYAWALIHKIAEAVRITPDEVYRRELKEIGGASEIVCVEERAVDRLRALWESKGLGWQTEAFPSKLAGCVNVRLCYGSSAFDTRQMSEFIDRLVMECKSLDIETLTERELSLLKEGWT